MNRFGIRAFFIGLSLVLLLFTIFLARAEPTYQSKPVSVWLDKLEFTNIDQPNPELYALLQIGPEALPYLTRRLRCRDSSKYYVTLYSKLPMPAQRLLPKPRGLKDRWLAAWALGEFGLMAQSAMPDLIHALNDPSSGVQRQAAEAIPLLGPTRTNSVAALIRALSNPDNEVQLNAIRALAWLGPDAAPAVPALAAQLHATNVLAREAAGALGQIGTNSASAMPALLEAFDRGDAEISASVIQAIGRIGPRAKQALPALRKILAESNHQLHSAAAYALARVSAGEVEAFQALQEALADSQCRQEIVSALWRLDPKRARGVAPKLINSLVPVNSAWPPEPTTQPFGSDWFLLAELGSSVRDAFPDFSPLLTHTNAFIRVFAAVAVWQAEQDADKVRSVLLAEINHTNVTVRRWAGWGLGKIDPGSPAAIAALVSLLDDKEGNVSGSACSVLSLFGKKAKPAVPAITRALRHENPFTRRMAGDALMKIDPVAAVNAGKRKL
ncbi:MAG: HEAT repeat domain-containing protein [Verrucomicrobia bacterium]|nr:HEAT repeat domain-containing protein [Verrucomicrobiota bacterium]